MRKPAVFAALLGLLGGCAPGVDCGPLDGIYLLRAELRAGDAGDCMGRVQSGLVSYDNGVSREPSSVDCMGYRERSADQCDVDFDEDCAGTDEFGEFRFRRTGSLSQVASGRVTGIVEVEFLEYYTYPFACVFDVEYTRQ